MISAGPSSASQMDADSLFDDAYGRCDAPAIAAAPSTAFLFGVQVRKSMSRIKHVLNERVIAETDPEKARALKYVIDAI